MIPKLQKTKKSKGKIAVIIFIAAAAISLKFFYLPVLNDISKSKRELGAILLEEKSLEGILNGRNEDDVNKELNSLKNKFLKSGQSELVMQYLTKAANKTGVNLISIDSMPIIKQGKYSEIPIQIKLNGGYYGIADYLDELRSFNVVIDIREIKVSSGEPMSSQLNVEALAVVYML